VYGMRWVLGNSSEVMAEPDEMSGVGWKEGDDWLGNREMSNESGFHKIVPARIHAPLSSGRTSNSRSGRGRIRPKGRSRQTVLETRQENGKIERRTKKTQRTSPNLPLIIPTTPTTPETTIPLCPTSRIPTPDPTSFFPFL